VGTVTGKDGAVRGLKLRQGNGYVVERPLQLVCDLEIGGESPDFKLNPEAEVFTPRLGPEVGGPMNESRTLLHKSSKTMRVIFKLINT